MLRNQEVKFKFNLEVKRYLCCAFNAIKMKLFPRTMVFFVVRLSHFMNERENKM